MRAHEFIVNEGWKSNALVGALITALASPAQAFEPSPPTEPSTVAKAIGIVRMINRYKDYNSASLEGEARQEAGNIARALAGHPNQSKLLPLVQDMMSDEEPIEVPKSVNLNQIYPRSK
jgi:hypothetical protein